jgi:hypothetical protein
MENPAETAVSAGASDERMRASPARSGWSRWVIVALGLFLGSLYLGMEAFVLGGELGFPLDDSWIHLQFARNLAAGQGLSFNPGELVTGSTAPLWTALLSLFFVLPGSPIVWTKLLGLGLYVLSGELTFRVARELGLAVGLSGLAAVLVLITDWMVWSAVSGLEIPLFVVLTLWGILLHLRERRQLGPPRSLAVLGLACLARPEGQLLLLLAVLDRCLLFERAEGGELRWRRPEWRAVAAGVGLALLLLLPMAAFNTAVGGSPLPTTYAAKVGGGGATSLVPSLRYFLQAPVGILFRSQPYMVLLAAAGVMALIMRLGGPRDRGLLPAAWLVALPVAYAAISSSSGDTVAGNFGRYFFPLFPVLVVVGVLGLERLAETFEGGMRIGPVRVPLRALLLVLLLWPTVTALVRGGQRYVQNVVNVHDSDVRAARWLGGRLAPEAVLAVNDIGAFGYFLPNRILDLAGIAHPEARRYRVEAAAAGRPAAEGTLRFLEERRPDYLVIFPQWFPSLLGEGSPFRPLKSFTIDDNITMGGSEIAVLSTPWTSFPLDLDESETEAESGQ